MIRRMVYTKDNGEVSARSVIIVAGPRDNYLCYDVSNLDDYERAALEEGMEKANTVRDEFLTEYLVTHGVNPKTLWRSFKPQNIDWIDED